MKTPAEMTRDELITGSGRTEPIESMSNESLACYAEYCRRNMNQRWSEITYDGAVRVIILPELIRRLAAK